METHGSFHGIYSWKIQLMEAMEASTSIDFGNFHVILWKLPLTSMEVNLLPPTSMEISMEVNILPLTSMQVSMEVSMELSMDVSMEVGVNFHGNRSNGSRWTLMEVLWKQLEVCNTRGSRWKYVGDYGSSSKLPRNVFVEADGSNGSFHFHRQRELPCISMETCTNFHGSESTSTNFHGNSHGS